MSNENRTYYGAQITGTGSAFPKKILTNHDLAKMVDTNHDWIVERTGIHQRHVSEVGNEAETNSSLGLAAAKKALEMAGKKAEDIDQILFATCSPDTMVPSTSCWLQMKLGAKNASALDMNAACSGFVFALSHAHQFIQSGMSKTVLVVGSEVLSPFVNWNDRSSCILFGDGSGAAIVERVSADEKRKIYSSHLGADGNLWELFFAEAGGSRTPVTEEIVREGRHKMTMKGKEIFKVAVKTLSDYAVKALEHNGFTADDLDWIVPHQANLRIIEAVAKRLDFPMEKVIVNIQDHGNTSAATVPTAFDQAIRSGKIKKGDLVLFDVFGAGLTFGSVLLRF